MRAVSRALQMIAGVNLDGELMIIFNQDSLCKSMKTFDYKNPVIGELHREIKRSGRITNCSIRSESNNLPRILNARLKRLLEGRINCEPERLDIDVNPIYRNLKKRVIEETQKWWKDQETGIHTKQWIENIGIRLKWKHFKPSFVLTQYITGHGAFDEYLHRIKAKGSKSCRICDELQFFDTTDDPKHRLCECPATALLREDYDLNDFELNDKTIAEIFEKKESFDNFVEFVNEVHKTYEELFE